jgi:large repetitive protein
MAQDTDSEKGKAPLKVLEQEQPVERAFVAPDGTITIPHGEADIISVDVADVDLLLSFSNGTFVVIPNGALDAISETPTAVIFNDNNENLGSLFKMVGISNVAKAGSLRVVSGNVDASKILEDQDVPKPPEKNYVTSDDVRLSDTVAAPSPMVKVGKGSELVTHRDIGQLADTSDPVRQPAIQRSTWYSDPQQQSAPPEAPTITLNPNITADDIINIAESHGIIAITGTVGGSAKAGDTVTLTVNGVNTSGLVAADKSFSINIAGSYLVADSDQTIAASITTHAGTSAVMESYTVDITRPVITAGQTFNYAENQAAGSVVAIVAATDNIGVTGYHFSATHSGTSADGFYTIASNGQISITVAGVAAGVAQNDYETSPNSFIYGIEATDAAGNISASQNVTLNVTNGDEVPPVVSAGQTFNYAENQTAGSVVAIVAATDDVGVTGYHFSATHTASSADGFYTIGTTGQISITAAGVASGVAQNDFDTAPNSFIYGIEATDAAGHVSAAQNVTLNVTNVDEAPPVIALGQTFNYTENQAAGSVVAIVAATDDVGVTGYHFSDTHTGTSADGYYTIGANGQISITAAGVSAGVAQNDFETAPNSFIYGIEATDAVGHVSAAQNITLTVTNMDEASPVIVAGQTFNYAENQAAGSVVATVAATDDVGVAGYHFSDTHSGTSADGYYTIGVNGQISITAAGVAAGVAQNDFETEPNSFIYGIEATDAVGNVSVAQNVTLTVTNVDEAPPVIAAGQAYNYTENQTAGAVVAIVAASDDVGVTGYHFSDTHTGTSPDGFYTIGANGQISITAAGVAAGVAQNDFETALDSFSYGIEATDAAGNVSAAQNVTLNVTNVDDSPPVIAAGQTFSYAENQAAGSVVAIVAASDDTGVTGYHFSATHAVTSADGFYTIGANGQISITAAGVAAGVAQNDFETASNSFSYGIEAHDAAGNVSTAQNVTLNVTNVDEVPPVVSSGQTFSYAENQAAGAVVAIVAASDNVGVTGYHFSDTYTDTSADGFYTIGSNGQIHITAAGVAAGVAQNDFETAPNSFIYGIEATDAAGNISAAQNVTLNVTNVNEAIVDVAAPVVTAGQTFSYTEHQLAGAVVATVAATDDVGVNGYHFNDTGSGTSADGFYTVGANGQISITAAGAAAGVAQNDFDTAPNSFIYGIEATDAAGHVSAVQNVTLNVTNVNEAMVDVTAPVITSGQTYNYTENQTAGAVVATVAATDDVGVTSYHFSDTGSGTSADGFYSIGANGQISITAAGVAAGVAQNDFETAPNSFSYSIEAHDAAGNVSTAQNITLNVTNVDEAPPVIAPGQTFNYAENQAAGSVVAIVAATDDVGVTGYHFSDTHTGTSTDGFYTIGANGQISITAAGVAAGVSQNDFETAPNSFSYGIEATDAAGHVSTAQNVTLNVTNVDEAPPVIAAGQTFNYAENQAAGSVVAIVAATDNIGVTGYHFSANHSGTSADGFYTIGANGQIHITAAGVAAGVAQNDFETAPNSFSYSIEAHDAAGNVSTAQNITLNVTNVDEAPPVIAPGQTFNYAENQAAGSVVAIVAATDDTGVTGYHFSTTHTGTSADGFYTIGSNGQIHITAAGVAAGVAPNDFETAPNSFSYGIEATDAAGNISAAQNVTLNVTNVDEAPPVVSSGQTFSYAENQTAGAVVAIVAASDDTGVTGYHFSATHAVTSADGFYTIGANGQISITAAGVAAGVAQNDFETAPNSFIYGIEATDAAGNVSAAQNVTLNVTNVDEVPPVVTSGQTFSYAENQAAGAVVAIVAASDNIGVTGYHFSATHSGTSADGFYTIGANGQISLTAAGVAAGVAQNDFETAPNSFIYGIEATDAAGNVSTAQNVTLNVTNVDEAPPVVTAGQTFSYAENQTAGAVVAIVAASDDVGVTGYHFSATHAGTSADGFYTIGSTGQISITAAGVAAGVAQNDFETSPNSFIYGIEATDAAGHVSAAQNVTLNVTNVDETPAAPVITGVADNVDPVQGNVATGGHTNDTTPTFTGTAEANSIVRLYDGATLVATVNADASGNWNYTPAPLSDGSNYSFTATATNAAGYISDASTPYILHIDTSATTPAITGANDNVDLVQGNVVNGGTTNDSTPTLSGIAEANSTVTLYDGGTLVSTVTADTSGSWSYTTTPLSDGSNHSYTIVATDTSGNVSAASAAYDLHIDTTPPPVPSITAVNDNVDPVRGNVANGGYTNDTTPTLSGTGEANTIIRIYDGGTLVTTTAADAGGNWTYTTAPLSDRSTHNYTVTATDAAGNNSAASSAYSLHIATMPPSIPVISGAFDNVGLVQGNVTNGGYTNDTTPALSGTAEANSTVSLYDSGTQISTVTADGSGSWSYTPGPLSDGSAHSYTVTATDAAGNVSAASTAYTLHIDTAPPPVPSITGAYDNVDPTQGNVANGGTTNDTTPTFSGTAEANSIVTLYNGATLVTTVTVDAGGNWTYTPAPLAIGTNLSYTATATDAVGNTSAASPVFALLIDIVPPIPVITGAYDNVGIVQGNVASGGTTNDSTPTLSGTAEVNSTVKIYDGATLVITTVADSSGNWGYTPTPLSNGTDHSYTATATNAGGTSPASTAYVLHIDTFAQPPIITGAYDNVGSIQGNVPNGTYTNDTTPTLSGTAEANSTIKIYLGNGSTPVATTAADAAGSWSYTTSTLSNGTSPSYTAIAIDAAGNTSTASAAYVLLIDTAPPTPPTITSGPVSSGGTTNDSTPTLSGRADGNSTVSLYDGAALVTTLTATVFGTWSYTPGPVIDGLHNYTVSAADAVGNTSAPSAVYVLHVDTTPPPIPAIAGAYDNVGIIQGNVANGGITNDTTPTLSGTGEANSTIRIYDGATPVATVTADAGGNWSYTPASPIGSSTHTYTATASDPVGNSSAASTSYVLHIDTTPPPVPVISGAYDNVGIVQGNVANGGTTNDTTPTLSGTAEVNSTVNIYDGAILVSTVTADGSGNWSYTPAAPLGNSSIPSYTVTATDAAGNSSTASAAYVLHIDTSQPSPVITGAYDDVGSVQGNVVNGGYTNDTTPKLSGTAEAGSTVTLYDGASIVAAVTADAGGNWSYTPAPLNDGSIHNYTATATNSIGSVSDASAVYTVHIDTTIPNAPTVALNTDSNFNTVGTFAVTGTEAGATVEYSSDGGSWSTAVPTVSAGHHAVDVHQIDLAGNVSSATRLEYTSGSGLVVGDAQGSILIGSAGSDILQGAGGTGTYDTLYGNGGDDTLSGGLGHNSLYGGDGNNAFIGGAGLDDMFGGSGNDTASYANSLSAISASLASGLGTQGDALGDTYHSIENLIGSVAGHDTLTGDGNANILTGGAGGNNVLEGMAGADMLDGGGGSSNTASYEHATGGVLASLADHTANTGIDALGDNYSNIQNLNGSAYHDTLVGDSHDNILMGGSGADALYGGGGNDTASYATAHSGVFASLTSSLWALQSGDAAGDTFSGITNLTGSDHNDTLYGNNGNNTLSGGLGDDTLDGFGGDDIISGGAGNDTIYANQGHDSAYGGDNNDTFYVSSLPVNLPTVIDGGARDAGVVQDHSGNVMVLQDLVNGSYSLASIAGVSTSIDTLDINGDGAKTSIAISAQDVQHMVNNGAASQLFVNADNGDTLTISLAAGETLTPTVVDASHTDYTIYNASSAQIAQIHWHHA